MRLCEHVGDKGRAASVSQGCESTGLRPSFQGLSCSAGRRRVGEEKPVLENHVISSPDDMCSARLPPTREVVHEVDVLRTVSLHAL